MNVVLAVVALLVIANAVVGLALVIRYRKETRETRGDQLEQIVELWHARVARQGVESGRSAA